MEVFNKFKNMPYFKIGGIDIDEIVISLQIHHLQMQSQSILKQLYSYKMEGNFNNFSENCAYSTLLLHQTWKVKISKRLVALLNLKPKLVDNLYPITLKPIGLYYNSSGRICWQR